MNKRRPTTSLFGLSHILPSCLPGCAFRSPFLRVYWRVRGRDFKARARVRARRGYQARDRPRLQSTTGAPGRACLPVCPYRHIENRACAYSKAFTDVPIATHDVFFAFRESTKGSDTLDVYDRSIDRFTPIS